MKILRRLLRRQRIMGLLGLVAAASLSLMLSAHPAQASNNHAVAAVDLANHIVAIDNITTNTFIENVFTRQYAEAWETRSLDPTTDITRNTVDQTKWNTTTQLGQDLVLSIGTAQRALPRNVNGVQNIILHRGDGEILLE